LIAEQLPKTAKIFDPLIDECQGRIGRPLGE
jgi:hypothetical protein